MSYQNANLLAEACCLLGPGPLRLRIVRRSLYSSCLLGPGPLRLRVFDVVCIQVV